MKLGARLRTLQTNPQPSQSHHTNPSSGGLSLRTPPPVPTRTHFHFLPRLFLPPSSLDAARRHFSLATPRGSFEASGNSTSTPPLQARHRDGTQPRQHNTHSPGVVGEGGYHPRESAPHHLSTGAPTEGPGFVNTTELATLRQARRREHPTAWAPPTQYWSTN